jgi:hypothetical protein
MIGKRLLFSEFCSGYNTEIAEAFKQRVIRIVLRNIL